MLANGSHHSKNRYGDNRIKTVGAAKLCNHLKNRCGKQRKTVGACETVLSLENINKVLFRQYS